MFSNNFLLRDAKRVANQGVDTSVVVSRQTSADSLRVIKTHSAIELKEGDSKNVRVSALVSQKDYTGTRMQ